MTRREELLMLLLAAAVAVICAPIIYRLIEGKWHP